MDLNSFFIPVLCLITGYGSDGFKRIKSHEFFHAINWTDLVNLKVTPPFKPVCMLDNLAFNFDREYTSKTPKGIPHSLVITPLKITTVMLCCPYYRWLYNYSTRINDTE